MLKPLALAALTAATAIPPLAANAQTSTAQTIIVETSIGPVEAPKAPETLAVFDIGAADTLDALGLTADGIVTPLYVDYLDDFAADAEPIGTLFEPDYEALVALGPDLIVAGGRSAEVVPDLAKLAPTLDMTIWDETIPQALARLGAYGAIWDKQAEAAEIAETFNAKLAAAKAAMADEGRALMVLTNGPKVSAYGASGRFGWLYTVLGLTEAVENVEEATHGEAISFEFIRAADPEVLIVLDRLAATGQDGESAQVTLDNALVRETRAWQSGKVLYLDAARIYIANGGVQALMHTFDQFTDTFGR